MSGSMQPMMGGNQQMSPQVMALLAAAQRQPQMPMSGPVPGVGTAPPGQPQAGPQGGAPGPVPMPQQQQGPTPAQPISSIPPQSIAPPVGSPMAQNLQMFGQAATGGTKPAGQGMRMSPAEMAHMGRFGDSVLAHLTPGEMAVPPEAQTPQVMAALSRAFGSLGVSPQMFMAGSPQSSVNPSTGANEYSILGALLPVLGAVAGSIVPGIGTAAGAGLGGAAGGALGGVVDHTGAPGILLGALGGGAGGYLGAGGSLGGILGNGAEAAGGLAGSGTGLTGNGLASAASNSGMSAGQASLINSAGSAAAAPISSGELAQLPAASSSSMFGGIPVKAGLGAGMGAGIGGALAPPPQQTGSATPPGFDTPMHPINPQYGQLLGSGQINRPTFAGYNPYASVTSPTGPYNFYPTV